jgi:hypothetical protein
VVANQRFIEGVRVDAINPDLEASTQTRAAQILTTNDGLGFLGSKIGGQGFLLTPEERNRLITKNSSNRDCIFKYLGGEDINSSPLLDSDRYVIDFGQMTLEETEAYPDLIEIVRERVKPYRDSVTRAGWKTRWWQFAEVYPAMRAATARIDRCLVIARDPKHFCFSFQPTKDRVLNEKLYVFVLSDFGSFAILQSRPHVLWALLHSRPTGGAGTPSYSTKTCFRTFPFPRGDPRSPVRDLEPVGRALYDARAAYMKDEQVGLTITYNRMEDPQVTNARVEELRRLTLAMDRAVLAAYEWSDLEPPPFTTPRTDEEKRVASLFEDAVIDRLFALNAERAKAQGGAAPRAKGEDDDEDESEEQPKPAKRAAAKPRKKGAR